MPALPLPEMCVWGGGANDSSGLREEPRGQEATAPTPLNGMEKEPFLQLGSVHTAKPSLHVRGQPGGTVLPVKGLSGDGCATAALQMFFFVELFSGDSGSHLAQRHPKSHSCPLLLSRNVPVILSWLSLHGFNLSSAASSPLWGNTWHLKMSRKGTLKGRWLLHKDPLVHFKAVLGWKPSPLLSQHQYATPVLKF